MGNLDAAARDARATSTAPVDSRSESKEPLCPERHPSCPSSLLCAIARPPGERKRLVRVKQRSEANPSDATSTGNDTVDLRSPFGRVTTRDECESAAKNHHPLRIATTLVNTVHQSRVPHFFSPELFSEVDPFYPLRTFKRELNRSKCTSCTHRTRVKDFEKIYV